MSKQIQIRLLFGLCSLMLAFAGEARACAICFSGIVITPGQKLDSAEWAVVALPLTTQDRFRVVEVIKGDIADGATITAPGLSAPPTQLVMSVDGPTRGQEISTASAGRPLLLMRDKMSEEWTSIGAISADYAGWLRTLAATQHEGEAQPQRAGSLAALAGSNLSDAEWRERVAIVAPYLESADPLVAEIAYGEIARAPYGALRNLRPQLDVSTIAGWVNDPKLATRLPSYTLLRGIAGGPDEAVEVEQQIYTALQARDATNLAAMLAADLELRGPARVDWLEQTYFADRKRTLPEINAALLALSVHGGADGTVSRSRVIEAYRYFIKVRRPMAGFVAMELADWGAWDATADFVDIIKSKAVKDPAGEFAILSYLQRSPATAEVAALRLKTTSGE